MLENKFRRDILHLLYMTPWVRDKDDASIPYSFQHIIPATNNIYIRVDWKWRTWKWRTIKIAGHEIAGHENAGQKWRQGAKLQENKQSVNSVQIFKPKTP